jgi:predicted DCC family thiol-disulfide oxidoreductase YuxK
MTSPTESAARRGAGASVRGLTVLFDPACLLCRTVASRLSKQRQLVPLTFVPAGSAQAAARFPGLDHTATLREITVIGDGGQVYVGDAAWIACLWALARHRNLAYRLATPAGRPLARASVLAAAKLRTSLPGWADGKGWNGVDLCVDNACRVFTAGTDKERSDDGASPPGWRQP